jgi:hypothetical protein
MATPPLLQFISQTTGDIPCAKASTFLQNIPSCLTGRLGCIVKTEAHYSSLSIQDQLPAIYAVGYPTLCPID